MSGLARVSRQTFYEQFGGDQSRHPKEVCFFGAYDHVVNRAVGRVQAAYRGETNPQRRLCRAFEQLLAEVVAEPLAARFALVTALEAGPDALARMQSSRQVFERMIAQSFAAAPDGVALPPAIVKGVVCGIERGIRRRVAHERSRRELPALAGEPNQEPLPGGFSLTQTGAPLGNPAPLSFPNLTASGPLPPATTTKAPATKPLTRAQKLAKALRQCRKDKRKAKRQKCEKAARKRYAPAKKAKRKK